MPLWAEFIATEIEPVEISSFAKYITNWKLPLFCIDKTTATAKYLHFQDEKEKSNGFAWILYHILTCHKFTNRAVSSQAAARWQQQRRRWLRRRQVLGTPTYFNVSYNSQNILDTIFYGLLSCYVTFKFYFWKTPKWQIPTKTTYMGQKLNLASNAFLSVLY